MHFQFIFIIYIEHRNGKQTHFPNRLPDPIRKDPKEIPPTNLTISFPSNRKKARQHETLTSTKCQHETRLHKKSRK